jgi:hypothetical protein
MAIQANMRGKIERRRAAAAVERLVERLAATRVQSRMRQVLARRRVQKMRLARGPRPALGGAPAGAPAAEAAPALVLGKDKRWAALSGGEINAAVSLGWGRGSWERGGETRATQRWWGDLAPYEAAAAGRLGYGARRWDEEKEAHMPAEERAASCMQARLAPPAAMRAPAVTTVCFGGEKRAA